ncbi:MAG: 6-carboxytetrahydropterin synthase QueD [Bdellovibrionales bacterium]
MDYVLITKRLEFDAGHRLPSHTSKCAHLHGHRYALEVTLRGRPNTLENHAQQGMVLDFSDVKDLIQKHICDPWDHAFLVYEKDLSVKNFLMTLPNHKTVVMAKPPTVENLAQDIFEILKEVISRTYDKNLNLENVRLYETPNSWADVHAKNLTK